MTLKDAAARLRSGRDNSGMCKNLTAMPDTAIDPCAGLGCCGNSLMLGPTTSRVESNPKNRPHARQFARRMSMHGPLQRRAKPWRVGQQRVTSTKPGRLSVTTAPALNLTEGGN